MTARGTRERLELLRDLQRQLPRTRGRMQERTKKAIQQVEVELAGGRGVAGRRATR